MERSEEILALLKANQGALEGLQRQMQQMQQTLEAQGESIIAIEQKLAEHDKKFEAIEQKLAEHDKKFAKIEERLLSLEKRFTLFEERLTSLEDRQYHRFERVDREFERVNEMFKELKNLNTRPLKWKTAILASLFVGAVGTSVLISAFLIEYKFQHLPKTNIAKVIKAKLSTPQPAS